LENVLATLDHFVIFGATIKDMSQQDFVNGSTQSCLFYCVNYVFSSPGNFNREKVSKIIKSMAKSKAIGG